MHMSTDAVVVGKTEYGEGDFMLRLLSREAGYITAVFKRAKSGKKAGHTAAAAELLAYSHFTLYRGKGELFVVDSAQVEELFFPLRSDIEALSAGLYFAELMRTVTPAEERADDFLRLLLNSLHLLCKGKPTRQVEAVFTLRLLLLAGYMPDIVCCQQCGTYEGDAMFFSLVQGNLWCASCAGASAAAMLPVGRSVLHAMRHILYSPFEKSFAFALSPQGLSALCEVCERYAMAQLDRGFETLDFLKRCRSGAF